MRNQFLFAWPGLTLLLLPVLSLHVFSAEPAPGRLFPDLVLRYPVGDPTADNPLRDTEGPKTITAADLNGDGLADVITGNLDGSISVLLGQTEGLRSQILHRAVGLLADNSLRAVVAADFNGDGRMDVAGADIGKGGVVVLLGNGDGTLQPFWRHNFGPARALAVGDFNADGRADLLVACSPANCDWCQLYSTNATTDRFLCVLDGNGDGTFQGPRYLLSPGATACFYDVKAADVNQDGRLDALALDFSLWRDASDKVVRQKRVLIFTNDGAGSFTVDAPQRVVQVAGEGPRSFVLAYLDETLSAGVPPAGATLDLVVANRDSASLDLFLNQGVLNFSAPVSMVVGDSPRDVAAGDLDGDGWTDLVVVDRDEDVLSVLGGLGGGRFGRPTDVLPAGVSPRQVVLADCNGDGALDAAVNNRVSEDVSLFLGQQGLLGFLLPEGYYPAGFSPVSVEAVDFNHDGYPDVATANLRSHDVRVRLNLGDGSLGAEAIYEVDYGPAFLATDDVNADGNPDLVVSCLGSIQTGVASGTLVTLLGRSDGTFEPPIVTQAGPGVGAFQPYWLRLGDLSGDGLLDAAVSGINGKLVLFRGRGDGSFDPGVIACLAGDGRPVGLALGDFNRDARVDIATSRGKLFLNNGHFFDFTEGWPAGTGDWPGPTTFFTAGVRAWATEADDLDGDGNLDLLIALTFVQPDPIGVLYGRGDGSFTEPTVYEGPDVGAVALFAADMDGDGVKDIVVGNRCAATVIIMRGMGDRLFELQEIVRTYSVEDVAVADLNRDGRPDIIGVGAGLWPILSGSVAAFTAPRAPQVTAGPVRVGVYINELMPLNREFLLVNETTPDWVELYNHNSAAQSLGGWSLAQFTADGETNQWFFPAGTTIAPEDYLVVYCKRKPATNNVLYADFELSSDGENLALLNAAGQMVDQVVFPALPANVSYGRMLDGSRFFNLNPAPTIGSPNARAANVKPIADRKDPYVGPGGTCLGLNARFFDDVALAYAAVCYRLAGDANFTELAVNDDGRSGDKADGDGYFGVILPPLPAGAVVEYYLRAVDLEGQVDTSPGDVTDSAALHRVTVPQPSPAVRLSELVAANADGIMDENQQHEDWIELVNTSGGRVSLDGLALSKDYFDRASAWHFPSGHRLEPGERVLVFCDDDLDQGPLHASFKLLRGGDRVFLIQADESWTILDSLSFNALPADSSFGVLRGGHEAQWLGWPTPGGENVSLPVPLAPAGAAVRVYGRISGTVPGGSSGLALRWFGSDGVAYQVEASADLGVWSPAAGTTVFLGEGLYEWKESSPMTDCRFHRVIASQ